MTRLFTDRFILTPGPTEIPDRVRLAMVRGVTNPDLDPGFLELYKSLVEKLGRILGARRSSVFVMLGEAMLGLEAAIANLIRRGDRVLVVDNGVYGEGFADLVRIYGGEPILLGADWRRAVDPSEVDRALEKNPGVKLVTVVHCDTPSAILNPVEEIARVAREHGALTVVDAVSTVGAMPVDVDGSGIDVLIGGSQKALNAPPGLTILAVSERAWEEIERTSYEGFYLNLRLWRDVLEEGEFPYTMSDPLVRALHEAVSLVLEEGLDKVYERHLKAREASWRAAEALGLKPYPSSIEDSSPTVTALEVPEGIDGEKLREHAWRKYGVMIAGSWGRLRGRVVRVGHMGVTASMNHLILGYTALAQALSDMGFKTQASKVVEAIVEVYVG